MANWDQPIVIQSFSHSVIRHSSFVMSASARRTYHRRYCNAFAVTPGQSSVRNGVSGRSDVLYTLQTGLSAHA